MTSYPGIGTNAEMMAAAYNKGGAGALKEQIDQAIKDGIKPAQLDKMFAELKQRGVQVYEDNGALKVSEWGTDSTVGTAQKPAPAPEAKAPSGNDGYHPAARAFDLSWTTKVNEALTKKPGQ